MFAQQKNDLFHSVTLLHERGLIQGSNGNLSIRLERSQFLVTPSGTAYHNMEVADLVVVDDEFAVVEGNRMPSSEGYLHLAIYQARPDVHAVVHTHSPYASAVATTGQRIPPILDEMVVYLGGGIEVATYGFPGSEELASSVVQALDQRKAVLMRNHGLCAVGKDLEEATKLAIMAEHIAKVFIVASGIGGALEISPESFATEHEIYSMRQQVELS